MVSLVSGSLEAVGRVADCRIIPVRFSKVQRVGADYVLSK